MLSWKMSKFGNFSSRNSSDFHKIFYLFSVNFSCLSLWLLGEEWKNAVDEVEVNILKPFCSFKSSKFKFRVTKCRPFYAINCHEFCQIVALQAHKSEVSLFLLHLVWLLAQFPCIFALTFQLSSLHFSLNSPCFAFVICEWWMKSKDFLAELAAHVRSDTENSSMKQRK